MRCPKCQNHEPAGSTTCRMCFASLGEPDLDTDALARRVRATAAARSGTAPSEARRPQTDVWDVPTDRRPGRPLRPAPSSATAGIPALRRRADPVAVAALVCGLCALGPLAMLLGVWGRHRVHSRAARSGYALASIGLWLGLAATLVYLWLLVDSGGGASAGAL